METVIIFDQCDIIFVLLYIYIFLGVVVPSPDIFVVQALLESLGFSNTRSIPEQSYISLCGATFTSAI